MRIPTRANTAPCRNAPHENPPDYFHPYILKVGISGIRDSANFFHFPPKFRLRTRKPSRLHCTNASPSVCCLFFVSNTSTSYIDLLYFDNLLLKTPDLCNLRTFVAIFFVAIYALFPPIFGGQKIDSANLSTFRMYVLAFWKHRHRRNITSHHYFSLL